MDSATQLLHRLTSYEPGREWDEAIDDPRVRSDFTPNDLETFPWFYKRYPDGLPRLQLPRDLPSTAGECITVLAGRERPLARTLDLPHLSRLLHLSAGVVRTMERPYGRHLFRAAGSAGGRFPMELYVAIPGGAGLPDGVHWYHPEEHALYRVGPAPRGEAPAVIVTGVPWRTGWRYRERGFRHIYWDTGTMLAQTLAAADSAGIPAAPYSRFPDAGVRELVGADGVHEFPVSVLALGEGLPALEATGQAATGAVDAAPREFPLVTAAQRAGESTSIGAPQIPGPAVDAEAHGDSPVEAVILRRGSQRRMDPARSVTREVFLTAMTVAMRGITEPHFVAVHAVDGLDPGIYRWPDIEAPHRAGNLREELYRVALDQGLARDAAFVAIGATRIAELDDRQYREAHLASGLVEGRLHLAAYALGASASGMTFMDSEIPGLLGEALDALLFTCVGVPEYRSSAGGQPGAPTSVRRVAPRL